MKKLHTSVNQTRIKKQKFEFLEELKKIPIIQIVCERLGIGRATFYRWKKEDSKFSSDIDLALQDGEYLVNDLAESQLINKIKENEMSAISLWLKTHHPKYGNKLEVSGNLNLKNTELTEEEKDMIRMALKLTINKNN